MTLLRTTLLIMQILKTHNMGDIIYNDFTYNGFTYKITLLITGNKKHMCNVTFINVLSHSKYNLFKYLKVL